MKRFLLKQGDNSIAEGVMLSQTRKVVVAWFGEHPSLVVWPSFNDFRVVSVDGHDGKLNRTIEWLDE